MIQSKQIPRCVRKIRCRFYNVIRHDSNDYLLIIKFSSITVNHMFYLISAQIICIYLYIDEKVTHTHKFIKNRFQLGGKYGHLHNHYVVYMM